MKTKVGGTKRKRRVAKRISEDISYASVEYDNKLLNDVREKKYKKMT